MRTVGALILREVRTRYAHNRMGYLWALLEPLGQIGVIVGLFVLVGRRATLGMELVPFLVLGVVPWLMFRNIAFQASRAGSSNKALLLFPSVTTLDVVLAKSVLQFLIGIVVITLFVIVAHVFHRSPLPDDLPGTAFYLTALALLAFGFGMIVNAVTLVSPTAQRILPIIQRPLFFLSGIFYVTEVLPERAASYLLWNPVLQGIQLSRSAFFPSYETTQANPDYLLVCVLFLLFIGLLCERLAQPLVTPPS